MNLIFHHAALGDFVLTFPLLRSLDEPKTVVTSWQKASLAAAVFDDVTTMDIEMLEFTRLFAQGGPTSMSPVVQDVFDQATRIITFVSNGADVWMDNVQRLAPTADMFVVMPRPAADWDEHVTAFHREQLKRQDLTLGDAVPVAKRAAADGRVLLHPGSGGAAKCWAVEQWLDLHANLKQHGHEATFIIGEVERESDGLIETLTAAGEVVTCNTTLELYEALNHARVYVGNDAGPTHLAAQVGVPTVALFGPSSPRVWQPLGPRVTTIAPPQPQAMDWLDVTTVAKAVSAML